MERILIVDDNRNFRTSLKIGLNRFGFQVDSARDAIDAVQLLDTNQYDVMVTDIRMPKLNGYDLARVAQEMAPTMLIILISAYDFADHEKSYPELCLYPKLAKPFDLRALIEMFRDFEEAAEVNRSIQNRHDA